MMRITALSLLTALVVAFVPHTGHAADDVFERVMKTRTINCGYFLWAPNLAKDPKTGQMSGINYDIMEAVGRILKLKINWAVEVGPGDVATSLAANKFDVMCVSMWPSPYRYSDTLYSSRPMMYSLVWPIVRADDKRFDNGLDKVKAKDVTVTGIEGDVTADVAMEMLPGAKQDFLGGMASASEMILQITTKKADVLFIDEATAGEFSKTNPGLLKVVKGQGPVKTFGEHMMMKPGEYRLRDMLDMSLLQTINDGLAEKIAKKYADRYNTTLIPPAKDTAK